MKKPDKKIQEILKLHKALEQKEVKELGKLEETAHKKILQLHIQ